MAPFSDGWFERRLRVPAAMSKTQTSWSPDSSEM
jgi:hypothetical protein